MLATQYKAAQLADVSRQTINYKSNENPRPGFFIDIPGKAPRVDTEHPEFKSYCDKIKSNKIINDLIKKKTGGPSDEDVMKIFDAVERVIVREYGKDVAEEIKRMIIEELEG